MPDEEVEKHNKMEDKAKKLDEFHSWECVSLVMAQGQTLDFVIKSESNMMAFLNVLGRSIFQLEDSKFLSVYM